MGEAIKEGEPAPDFEVKDTNGNTVHLSDFKGKKVALYFYPKDDTPFCTMQACSFRDNMTELTSKGIVVLGASTDGPDSHKRFAEKYKLTFTLLADTTATLARKYHVFSKKNVFGKEMWGIRRTTFLIDENGRIKRILTEIDKLNHAAQVIREFEKT